MYVFSIGHETFVELTLTGVGIFSTKISRETLGYTKSLPHVSITPPKFVLSSSLSPLNKSLTKKKPFSHRSHYPESLPPNPDLSKRPYTTSPSGFQTLGSYTLHAWLGSRSSRSIVGFTMPLWKGWLVRISGCARKSRGRAIGMKLPRLCLGARDRLGRLGCCGRFLGCRIRKGHRKDPLFVRSYE